jgi:hypothetical protein
MPKYKVHFARTTWLTATVEVDDEADAVEAAYEVLPPFSAQEGGWGGSGWSADAGEWLPLDEFSSDYDSKRDGKVVEEATDD